MHFCKILIVDDDADDRELITDAFINQGIDGVYALPDPETVFSFLQEIKEDFYLPRLIVTDLNMPGISGFDLLKSLKTISRYQHIPVVILSTSSVSDHIDQCLACGAKDFITKPDAYNEYITLTKRITAAALG